MKSKTNILGLILILSSVFLFGFFGTPDDAIVKVGKYNLTQSQVNSRVASFPPQLQQQLATDEAKQNLIDSMVDELLLVNMAKEMKLHKSDEFKAQLAQAKKQILLTLVVQDAINNKVQVSDVDAQNYYNDNIQQFQAKEERKASHILVKTEKQAKSILTRAKAGSNFANLATKHSEDPGSKARGGDLGYFQRGQLVPEFEKAVYALKRKGSFASVVKSQFGYHVIRLDDIRTKPAITFEQAKDQIRQFVSQQKRQELTTQLLETAKQEYPVKRLDAES